MDLNSYETGWGLINDNGEYIESGVIAIPRNIKKIEKRLSMLRKELQFLFDQNKIDVVVLEDIFYDRKKGINTFKNLARLQGVVIQLIELYQLKMELLQAKEIRALIGKGSDDKEKVNEIITNLTNTQIDSYDESDSLAVAYAYIEKKKGKITKKKKEK